MYIVRGCSKMCNASGWLVFLGREEASVPESLQCAACPHVDWKGQHMVL